MRKRRIYTDCISFTTDTCVFNGTRKDKENKDEPASFSSIIYSALAPALSVPCPDPHAIRYKFSRKIDCSGVWRIGHLVVNCGDDGALLECEGGG